MPIKKLKRKLDERVKELALIHELSDIFMNYELTLFEIIQRVVQKIPKGFQFPDLTGVLIKINSETFYSNNYCETEWNLIQNLKYNQKDIGLIKISFIEPPPDKINPFLE